MATAVMSYGDSCRSRTTGGLAGKECEILCLYLDLMITFLIISAQLLYWISSACDDLRLHFTLDDIRDDSAPPRVILLYDWIAGELGLYIAEIKSQVSYTIILLGAVLRNVRFVYEVARWAFVL